MFCIKQIFSVLNLVKAYCRFRRRGKEKKSNLQTALQTLLNVYGSHEVSNFTVAVKQ